MFWQIISFILLFFIIQYLYKRGKEKFTVHGVKTTTLYKELYSTNEKLFNSSTTALFFLGGNIQTIFIGTIDVILDLLNKCGINPYKISYKRSIYELKDGGKIAIDNAIFKKSENINKNGRLKRKLLIIPGYTSYAEDFYLKDIISSLLDYYDIYVVTARGFGGIDLFNHVMISSYMEHDLAEYIEHFCDQFSHEKVFIIGFSFGGMMFSKYLCNTKNIMPKNLVSTCAISYPICIRETAEYTENILGGLYSWASCLNLRKCFFDNMEVIFKDPRLNKNKDEIIRDVTASRWSSNFDNAFTYKALGLESIDQYYDDIKLQDKHFLNIKVPFISIFAEDDPVVPINSVPIETMKKNKNIIVITVTSGGHNAFYSGFIPRRWLMQPIKSFFEITEETSVIN